MKAPAQDIKILVTVIKNSVFDDYPQLQNHIIHSRFVF